jgi:hypothetical protein
MSLTLLFRTESQNEDNDNLPGFAALTWTRELGARIATARALCRAHNLEEIRFHAPITWYDNVPESSADVPSDDDDDEFTIHTDDAPRSSSDPTLDPLLDAALDAAWERTHERMEHEKPAYLVLTDAQAAHLDRQPERSGIRRDCVVVTHSGLWWIAGFCKYSNDAVEGGGVSFDDDPWAEVYGYPHLTVAHATVGARASVPITPTLLLTLQSAQQLLDVNSLQGEFSVPVPVPVRQCNIGEVAPPATGSEFIGLSPLPGGAPELGRIACSRFSYRVYAMNNEETTKVADLSFNEFRQALRDAAQHLSVVAP